METSLYQKIMNKEEAIAVVGLGYVGMPLAVAFAKHVNVIGYDRNEDKIEQYLSGFDPTDEVGDAIVLESQVEFTYHEEALDNAKFFIVAVPTPINSDKTPDLRPVEGASKTVGRHITKGSIVVYESTVYPGVTEEICIPILEKESKLKCGEDFMIGYSPERINPGDKVHRLENIVKILSAKGAGLDCACAVKTTQLRRITGQIAWMCQTGRGKTSPFDTGVLPESGVYLTAHDTMEAVLKAVAALGYDLSEEDSAKVYEAFGRIAQKKQTVSEKELDAIVASAALQVPPTYRLESYVINTGNTISASAHMKLTKNGQTLEGISLGDGPIDAAFIAIEQIVGHHYELDDFQIQAVTEGREAMGESVVKLRSAGKLYSGRGISTDIVGASIRAYLSALNKIVYEEAAN